jgi:hypothetical protein
MRLVENGAFPYAVPARLLADADAMPPGDPDEPRDWCTICGLPDAPKRPFDKFSADPPVPCPRCGSTWRWYGRLADLTGTAAAPPAEKCWDCYQWRQCGGGQEHFGWAWWRICKELSSGQCVHGHAHHDDEVWIAAAG